MVALDDVLSPLLLQVAIPRGTRLLGGTVSTVCQQAGMTAVCHGNIACSITDITKYVLPLQLPPLASGV